MSAPWWEMLHHTPAARVSPCFLPWMLFGLLCLAWVSSARGEPAYAREFKGAIELEAGRVLAWEFVSDGSGEMPLWIFAEGRAPRQVGKLAAEQITAATGSGAIVLVADQRLFVTGAKDPGQPAPVDLPGEWASVVHGAMGFVVGGWGDTCALSPDGKTWTPFEFKAPDNGGIAQLAWNGKELLALRQTSVMEEGWGINVSELCLSTDGKAWRRVARFEGGSNGMAVDSIAWVGDRWIGHGMGVLVELMPDGKSRRIAPTSEDGENALFGGNVAVFRDGARWLLTSDAGVAGSQDLADWKFLPKTGGDDLKGVWLAAHDGTPRFVGSTKRDWSRQQVLTLAGLLNPPAETRPAAPVNVASAPAKTVAPAAPVKQASQELSALILEIYASTQRAENFEETLRLADRALVLAKQENHERSIDLVEDMRSLATDGLLTAGIKAYEGKNHVEARRLWELAAAGGQASAMYNLGVLYAKGEGVAADQVKAFAWRKKSAEAGYAQGMVITGTSYATGSGVEKDPAQARHWFEQALAEELPEDLARRVRSQLAALASSETAAPKPLPLPAPRGTVLAGGKPRGPDTVYDWPAIMAAAVKRAAAEPPRELHESIAKKRGTKTNAWSKGSPWTAADMIAAFKKGASARDVVQAMGLDYDGSDLDKPGILTVLTSPEWPGALKKSKGLFDPSGRMVEIDLWGLVYQRSILADALAREVIARRQRDVVPVTKPVDSPELRRRVAAGEAEAAYQLYQLYFGMQDETDRQPAPAGLPPADQLIAQATNNHAPAQWLLAAQFEHNTDKTKNDPLRVFDLYWVSANAGDPIGAFKLAKLFAAPGNENGVARNYAEAEYWFIEAAVRAWPGQMDLPYQRPWLELANLYSAQSANDVLSTLMATYEDATARWLRLMNERGGVMADYAQLAIRYFDEESAGNPNAFNYAKRIAAIPPELPVLPADAWQKIEASAAGRAKDLLRVADAYAGGRLVRQHDGKAVEFYHRAAEAGAGLPAYRALMHHYRNGYGVAKDITQWLAWLTKAAATDDVASLLELGDALHFSHQGVTADYAAALAAYQKAAALGDARAFYAIGLMHRYGRGGPKDEGKWREFMEQAAAKGHTRAMADIAYSYISNEVPWDKKNHAEAAVWYRKAVDAGGRNSRFALAEALHNSQDAAGAEKWLRELAAEDPGHVQARYKLAQMADRDGRRDEAARWFREVAALDTIYDFMKDEAQRFVREYDEEEAAKPGSLPYYRKKAKTGTTDDMFEYAMRVAPSHRAQAESWLAVAADQGHAPATAVYYEWTAQNDRPAAEKWIKFQADRGNAQAVLILGLLTAATDKPAGLALVRKAAEAGNADAIFRVGMMQYNGNELPQNRAAGLAAIATAADAGFPLAQFTLGRALLKGDVDLPADPQRAIGYLKRVMANDYAGPVALQAAVLLGQVYESGQIAGIKADLGAAVEAYGRATKFDPRNTKLLNHYHEVQRRMSQEMKMR
jgi:TPR repeat protein